MAGYRRGYQPVVFSPANISNLAAWYDFSNIATLFKNNTRSSAVTADGDTILGVTDLSGKAKHFDTSNPNGGGTAPIGAIYKAGITNLLSIARFDGSTQFLSNGLSTVFQSPFTIVCSVSCRTANSGALAALSINQYSNVGNYGYFALRSRATTDNEWASLNGATATEVIDVGSSCQQYTLGMNGTTYSYARNGGTAVTATGASAANNDTFTLGGLWRTSSSFVLPAPVDWAELCIYSRWLTTGEETAVRTYLKNKWGTP